MAITAKDILTQEGRKQLLMKAVVGGKNAMLGVHAKKEEEKNDFGVLSLFCEPLVKKAKAGLIDPVVGRDSEVRDLIEILERRNKNNAMIVGDSGVGKTAIVNKLAQKIAEGSVPNSLKDVEILSLDPVKLISGNKLRSDMETRLTKVLAKAGELTGKCILFIDNVHDIANEDAGESVSMLLRNTLVRSITVTSADIYRKSFEKDPSFIRRFHTLTVEPTTVPETIAILKGLSGKYADHYRINLSDDSIDAAVKLSDRYIPGRKLPGKALDLIDQASAILGLELEADPGMAPTLLRTHVSAVIQKWTGIPSDRQNEDQKEKLRSMEPILNGKVIGQERATVAVCNAVRRARMGISDPKKPTGTFLFLGPTGVGKTELAKALAEFMFDDPDAMLRIDMSEFGEKHTVARLLGAPPGYAGHDQGGQLTDPIRQKPYQVVLFDEIEKGHPDVFNIFLQILDEGRLTDQQQRIVDFRNTVIIMTSNIGSRHTLTDDPAEAIRENVMGEVKKFFKPELLNRIDDVVVFNKLTKSGIRRIVDLQLKSFIKRFEDKRISFEITDKARDWLADAGYDPAFGARPLKRAMQAHLENRISEDLMYEKFKSGDLIFIDCEDSQLRFSSRGA